MSIKSSEDIWMTEREGIKCLIYWGEKKVVKNGRSVKVNSVINWKLLDMHLIICSLGHFQWCGTELFKLDYSQSATALPSLNSTNFKNMQPDDI